MNVQMSESQPAGYLFGAFHVDLESGELRREYDKVPIRPKCFDLLVYLLRNRGKLIAKDTLLDTVWSDAIVAEATLSRTITELREVLGDHPQRPKFIQTVSRRGYRFIAPAHEIFPATADEHRTELSIVHRGKEYPLRSGEQVIGRGRGAAIPLYNSLTSRHHARITVNGKKVSVEDLGSKNGTFVNGHRVVKPTELKVGDQIQIGGEILTLWSPTGDTSPGVAPVTDKN
jgi:DNA-binding winged helix-turn-helix (wHTH) protein